MERPASKPRGRWLALAVFVVVLCNGVFWSAAIPFDDAPDEKDHYDVLEFVARQGRLPRYGEESFTVHLLDVSNRERVHLGTDSGAAGVHPWPRSRYELRHTYLFSPQLPYLLGGWFMRVLGGPSVAKARLWSALCIALAAAATVLAARLLWPQSPVFSALAGLVFGLWPQVTFVGAYVNDDAFAMFAATAVLLACVRADTGGLTLRRAVGLGIALGILGLAKFYVLALVPLVLVWAVLHLRRHGRSAARLLVLSALLGSMLAVAWPIRNTVLYGDALGRRFMNQEVRSFIDDLPSAIAERTPRKLAETSLHATGDPVTRLFERGWIRHSLQSFWGWFGWMAVRMPPLAYATALLVVGGLLTTSIVGAIRKRRPSESRRESPLPELFALPFLVLLALFSLANSYFADFQPQGRYLLACVPALAMQIVQPFTIWRPPTGVVAGAVLLAFFVVQNLIARFATLQ